MSLYINKIRDGQVSVALYAGSQGSLVFFRCPIEEAEAAKRAIIDMYNPKMLRIFR